MEILSSVFQECLEKEIVLNLNTAFLAFASDAISQYAFGESMGLQKDRHHAGNWNQSIRAVASMTPIAKQFPWIISWTQRVPIKIVRLFLPRLARLLQFHRVGIEMFLNMTPFLVKDLYTLLIFGYASNSWKENG